MGSISGPFLLPEVPWQSPPAETSLAFHSISPAKRNESALVCVGRWVRRCGFKAAPENLDGEAVFPYLRLHQAKDSPQLSAQDGKRNHTALCGIARVEHAEARVRATRRDNGHHAPQNAPGRAISLQIGLGEGSSHGRFGSPFPGIPDREVKAATTGRR